MIHLLAHEALQLPNRVSLIDRVPTIRLRNKVYKILIKLGIIKRYGHAILTVYHKDGSISKGEGYNIIMDTGKGELADLMLGVVANTLNAMNVGTSDATPNDSTLTDLVSPAAPASRLAIPSGGRFRTNLLITLSVLIASGQYTRPFTAKEMAVYFDPTQTGKIFARATITAVTLIAGDSGRMDYEVQL